MRSIGSIVCSLAAMVFLAGCGGGAAIPKDRPTCTKVAGIVTMDGSPVEGATVTLHPTSKGYGAFGVSDASGKFVLETFVKGDGAVPGEYKISVKKLEGGAGGAQPGPGDPGYDPNPKPVETKNLLPAKYAEFLKSGLSATVGNTPITDLKVELQSK